jgi:hypothetical protein
MLILKDKANGETIKEVFDFTSRLAVGETISTATVTAAVYSGTDPTPTLVSGAATIQGAQVTQLLAGGVAGTTYLLTCFAVTSSGQTLALQGYKVVTS